jgi:DNA polymerase-1
MTTLLVDGNNVLMRAIRAMQYRPLSNDHVPTGALLVYINTLAAHVRENRPDRVVVCWDGGGSAERTRQHPEYKGNRAGVSRTEEEQGAFTLAARFTALCGIPNVMETGVEADDLIAYLTVHRSDRTVILSNDKDFRQLVADDVDLVRISGGGAPTDRWTIKRIREEHQCEPGHLALAMAIAGDTADNIAGVPGFGEKNALKALRKHDFDLDAAIAGTPRLSEAESVVRRNLALVDLRAPLAGLRLSEPPRWTPPGEGRPGWEDLMAFLHQYRIFSVMGRLKAGTLWAAATLF